MAEYAAARKIARDSSVKRCSGTELMCGNRSVSRLPAILLVSILAGGLAVSEAKAQSIFSDIFGWIIKPKPSTSLYGERPPSYYSYNRYRTVCVRLCDGYYFPVGNSTPRQDFHQDAQKCQAQCSADSRLFYMPANSSDMEQAVDLSGLAYANLMNAFVYRKKLVKGCSCRPAPWSPEERARHKMYETNGTDVARLPDGAAVLTGTQDALSRQRYSGLGYNDRNGAGGDYQRYQSDIEQGPVARPKAWVRQYTAGAGGVFGGTGAAGFETKPEKRVRQRRRARSSSSGTGGPGPSFLWPESGD